MEQPLLFHRSRNRGVTPAILERERSKKGRTMKRMLLASLCVLLAAISLAACDGAPTGPEPGQPPGVPIVTPASPEPGEAPIGTHREPTQHPAKVTVPDIRFETADASPIEAQAAAPSPSAKVIVTLLGRLAAYARQRPTPCCGD
jgi:hypothetical protein